jgi:2-polyprenyl-3-methyl-5-hydroxy-6-metoxy-1,4-benzoquinol methylase
MRNGRFIRELREKYGIDVEELWRNACKTPTEELPERMMDDEVERAFWRQAAVTYDDTPKFSDYAPQVLEKIHLLLGDAKRVLEIGSGTGKFTVPLAKYFEEVIALDHTEDIRTRQQKWEDVHIEQPVDAIFLLTAVYRMLDIRRCLTKMNDTARHRMVLIWT